MKHARILLKHGKDTAVKRFHPWIFSGAIGSIEGDPAEGDIVDIYSSQNRYLATGYYTKGSIAVKLFSFTGEPVNNDFWFGKLKKAYELRKGIGLTDSPYTNAYRLVHSEGDGLPGLIIDYYNGIAVIQSHSWGMYRIRETLCEGLVRIYGDRLKAVYDKSSESLAAGSEAQIKKTEDGFLKGTAGVAEITETGHRFHVDFIRGQKTGFFLDQRSNRMFAQFYARERKVLNAFCYSGTFSVYALKGGATEVHSLDSSKQALAWTHENLDLNGLSHENHREIHADAKQYIASGEEQYGMIILDPPAFAKSHKVTNNALHAYIHINRAAIRRLSSNGILMTFSCSQAISRDMFRSAIQSASIEEGRDVTLLHHLGQGPDHPVSLFHPEGEYLKGLIVEVR